jgi:hypothetical protein
MKIKHITESTAGGTSSGAVASVAMPIGGTQKRAGSLFKGKKTKKKFYEGKVKELAMDLKAPPEGLSDKEFKAKYKKSKSEMRNDKKPMHEAELSEQDLIVVPGMRRMKDTSFIPHKADRRDHEVEMARSDLYAAAKDAMRIFKLLKDRSEDEGLMGWQQSYITLAADYLNSVADSVEYNAHMNEMTGGVITSGMSNFEEGRYYDPMGDERREQQAMDDERRDFKRREMDAELGHEKNNYAVAIDGRTWKVFGDKQQAENIARSLRRKGKKAEVYITGASPSIEEGSNANIWIYNEKENQYYGPYSSESAAKLSGRLDANSEIRKLPSSIRNPRTLDPSDTRMANARKGAATGTKLAEKAVSKQQQKFMGMVHAMQKGEKIPGASKELKAAAKGMTKKAAKDFAKTKHKGLPEKVKKK